MSFCSSKNGPYIGARLVTPKEKSKHTGSTTSTDVFAPASTIGRPRGGRAQAGFPLSALMPTHPRREPGPKRLREAHPQTPHKSDPHVYCCYYCCMLLLLTAAVVSLLLSEVKLVQAGAATVAVLLLRFVEQRVIFLRTIQRSTKNCKRLSKISKFGKQLGVFEVTCSVKK